MNRIQKAAFFNLLVVILSLLCFFTLVPFVGWEKAHAGLALLAVLSLYVIFEALYNEIKKKQKGIIYDERDEIILQKANYSGFAAGYFYLGFVCLIPSWIYRSRGDVLIPVSILLFIFIWGFVVSNLVRAVSILVLYGREPKEIADAEK